MRKTLTLAAGDETNFQARGQFVFVVASTAPFLIGIRYQRGADTKIFTEELTTRSRMNLREGSNIHDITLRNPSAAPNTVTLLVTDELVIPPSEDGADVNVINIPPVGQAAMAVSLPVTIASDQSDVPVSIAGTVAVDVTGAGRARIISAASTNAGVAKAAPGRVHAINGTNTSGADVFLKLYNDASAPTVGTDTPVETYALLAGASFSFSFGDRGAVFAAGIAYAITANIGDGDATAIGAGDAVLTIHYT